MVIPSDCRQRGFVLVEILLVIAIIALLAGAYLGLRGGQDEGEAGEKKSTPARAIEKAHSVECMNNLRQLRMLIQMEVVDSGGYPKTLKENALSRCPVSGKPYVYDPNTGQVRCTTPGHERF